LHQIVYIEAKKIAAVGVKVDARGITSHGFALNVNPDLRYFEWIVPCGIHDREVTSLAKVLGHPVSLGAVTDPLVTAFAGVFGLNPQVTTVGSANRSS